MAVRVPQPHLAEPPERFGARRAAKLAIEIANQGPTVSLPDVEDAVDASLADHLAAADPHTQYVANDPALRS